MILDTGRNWVSQRILNLRNRMQRRDVLGNASIEDRFTRVYELNYWGDEESRSGSGSTMVFTKGVRAALPRLVKQFNITSMFDAPCGDYNWMRTIRHEMPIRYIGGDIVKPIIDANSAAYGSEDTSFVHCDITRDPLPAVDLWFCRDCLFHLSYADARLAFENFVRAGIPYALFTTHVGDGSFANKDIATGDFRQIDLFEAPYNLPRETLAEFDDYLSPGSARKMHLWHRDQIIASLA